jgi:dTDP-3-amino-3,4,6-trideoxy-alpha-D-glucose transaminase
VQAALLAVKLRRLAEHNARRDAAARRYDAGLAGMELVLPERVPGTDPVWHLYVVRSPHRDRLREHLATCGVETLVHYPVPPHRQRAFAGTGLGDANLPMADRLAREVLSLPMGPTLRPEEQDAVIEAVRSFRP